MGLGIGAAISGLAGIGSSLIGSSAASSASKQQAAAAALAAADQLQETKLGLAQQKSFFDQGASALNPFITGGQTAYSNLQSNLPSLTAQFAPTQAQLEATPGYQFTKQQGLEATQNSFAAQGLANSGSALKGAAQYATGLANTTYNQQLQNYLAQNLQSYNMQAGTAGIGEQAAGALTGASTSAGNSALSALQATGQGVANSVTQGGNAAAAGTLGSANALQNGINSVGNSFLQYSALNSLLGGGGIGGMPATGAGSPSNGVSNLYAFSQGINPFAG